MFVNEFAQGNAHFFFDGTRIVHMTRDAEKLCTTVTVSTERVEPVGATADDGWGDSNGFDVGDGGRAPKETHRGGERGL